MHPASLHCLVLFGDWAGLLLGAGLLLTVVLALVLAGLWVEVHEGGHALDVGVAFVCLGK